MFWVPAWTNVGLSNDLSQEADFTGLREHSLDSVLKSIIFANKVLYSQSYGFSSSSVWMWELDYKEDWAPENWCIWTVVLEKIIESPLDYKEINQSIIKEINPEDSLEGLMLKLQYFSHLMGRANSLEKTLMLAKIKGRRRRDDKRGHGWMASPTQWTWVMENSRRWWKTGKPGVLQFMGSQRNRTWLSNWTMKKGYGKSWP